MPGWQLAGPRLLQAVQAHAPDRRCNSALSLAGAGSWILDIDTFPGDDKDAT